IRQRGFLKFMSKPMIEVLAAIDEYPGVKSNTTSYSSNDKNWNSNNEPVSKSREKEEKIILLENKVNSMENILQKIYEEVQRPGKNLDKELTNQKVSKVIELFQNNLENNEVDTKIIRQLLDMVEERCNSNISV